MEPGALLDVLTAGGRRADRITHVEHLPARAGVTAPWPAWADPDLVAGWTSLGVAAPWTHQAHAAQAAHDGRHTVLATSTGSGKSLAFWLPALTAARGEGADPATLGRIETVGRRAATLYLCPTKALAADQLHSLDRVLAAAAVRDVRTATCDGDSSREERRWAADHADVVLTNPDFLHFAVLPQHARWARLLRSLRYVVLDECHAFRGVFGAHVALVLRRLRRVCEAYGASPTFLLASATTAEPAASAARLIGVEPEEVEAVTQDGSPAGSRTFLLWRPPVQTAPDAPWSSLLPDEDPWSGEHPRRSVIAEVADLLADLTSAGARTLAFTRSRRAAESLATVTRQHLAAVDPDLPRRVAAYRGGYLPEERRDLEDAVRTGRIRALATTNALELGVDISGLDAVVLSGWPGTRVSLWQQAGRAGRAGADGVVAFVAREDPLDTYLVEHPEAVFGTGVEATVFDPGNPYVLGPHLCAAAAEQPLRAEELDLFGPRARAVLDVLVAQGALRRRPSGWYWTHAEPASRLTNLRGTGGDPVRVIETSTGRVLGTVESGRADAQVHDGAVYVHQGVTYVVDELHLADHVALATRRDVDYGTYARWFTSNEIVEVQREGSWGPVGWAYGQVDVTSQVLGYQRKRLPDLTVLGSEELDLPAQTLRTASVWWTVPAELLLEAGVTAEQVPGALHAAEHASIGVLPLLATCDRWDLGGLSTALHADTGKATVFVHDAFPGGAGFAERGYELAQRWLAATLAVIAACPCAHGCPACVQSPKCGNQNSPLEKDAARRLLAEVLAHAPGLDVPLP